MSRVDWAKQSAAQHIGKFFLVFEEKKVKPLFPVILPVSFDGQAAGKEKVAQMRRVSREALRICAQLSAVRLVKLEKDVNGVPIAFNGVYWSVSHKSRFGAAVLGEYPIGIDIEEVKPRSDEVIRKVISRKEEVFCWQEEKNYYFFMVWTAKEAVLKAEGVGLAGLGRCFVVDRVDKNTLLLDCEGKLYQVVQASFNGHIASLVTRGESVQWIFPCFDNTLS